MAAVTSNPIRNFFAFDTSYRGGVNVAAGDIDGDGSADIIVGKATGNVMDVRAFSGKTGAILADFSAFDQSFTGGVTVAVGDTNGDHKTEIVVGANVAPANNVKVFRGINGDGIVELVAVSGPASPPQVNILNSQTGTILRTSSAMPPQYSQGLTVG